MNIQENVDLREHSTMRLGGKARWFAKLENEDEIPELLAWADDKKVPVLMIGQGSNIVWRDEGYSGLLIENNISGKELLNEDDQSATIRVAAGEIWDEVVDWTMDKNLSGIESLSLIPGKAGAAPIQNIGAYGAEISDTLIKVTAFDLKKREFVELKNQGCQFGYRTSRFKTTDKGRFLIMSMDLRLLKKNPGPPFYEAVEDYFQQHNIKEYTPKVIRKAVIDIRNSKLPDPAKVANNGSFFTNPIVERDQYEKLKLKFPDVKVFPFEDKFKLAAGWLVEKAGFKDIHDSETGMATWSKQALVLVNEKAKNTADLLKFRQKIIDKVQEMFGITLQQEPELLP